MIHKPGIYVKPFQKMEVLIFGAALVFFPLFGPFDAHRYRSQRNRSISRSAASALKCSCQVHTLTMVGMGDFVLGWFNLYKFPKTHGVNLMPDAFFNADYVELIKTYLFLKKKMGSPLALQSNINLRANGGLGQLRTYGGGADNSPPPLPISETTCPSENRKHQKALVKLYSIYRDDFEIRSIMRSRDVIKGQVVANFHIFFQKYASISETVLGRRPRKKHSTALKLFFR